MIMHCAYCAERREWPQDFPNPTYAVCVDCYALWSRPKLTLFERIVAMFFGRDV